MHISDYNNKPINENGDLVYTYNSSSSNSTTSSSSSSSSSNSSREGYSNTSLYGYIVKR